MNSWAPFWMGSKFEPLYSKSFLFILQWFCEEQEIRSANRGLDTSHELRKSPKAVKNSQIWSGRPFRHRSLVIFPTKLKARGWLLRRTHTLKIPKKMNLKMLDLSLPILLCTKRPQVSELEHVMSLHYTITIIHSVFWTYTTLSQMFSPTQPLLHKICIIVYHEATTFLWSRKLKEKGKKLQKRPINKS